MLQVKEFQGMEDTWPAQPQTRISFLRRTTPFLQQLIQLNAAANRSSLQILRTVLTIKDGRLLENVNGF